MRLWSTVAGLATAATIGVAGLASTPAQAQIYLWGTDAWELHGDAVFAAQASALLNVGGAGAIALVNDYLGLANGTVTTVAGVTVTSYRTVGAALAAGGFSGLEVASPGSCCSDPGTSGGTDSMGIAAATAGVLAFLTGGGKLGIENFGGNAVWDGILGFASAPGVVLNSGCGGDPGISNAAGIGHGFTGGSPNGGGSGPGTGIYVEGCFVHQAYDKTFFAGHGFASLIDNGFPIGDFPIGSTGVVLTDDVAVPGPLAGAGLPGLIAAGGAFLGFRRRRKAAAKAA